jgi:hypothetical protein
VSTLLDRPAGTTRSTTDVLGAAALAGIALGVLDLGLQMTLPYPFANLANSSAVWALCAFAFAVRVRTTPSRAALAGSTMLVVAVETYYVAAVLLDRASWLSLWSSGTIAWAVFGVLAGTVFGIAGTWLRDGTRWQSAAGLAAAAAVFYAEAGTRVLPGSGSGLSDAGTVLLTLALGTAVLMSALPRPVHLARAVVLVVPLSLLGTLAFRAAGFA